MFFFHLLGSANSPTKQRKKKTEELFVFFSGDYLVISRWKVATAWKPNQEPRWLFRICFFIFTPILGEDEPILTIIFFKGVG